MGFDAHHVNLPLGSPDAVMFNGAIDYLWQKIAGEFSGFFDWLILIEWGAIALLIVGACYLGGFFLQFTWVRAVLGWIASIAIAVWFGAFMMFRKMRSRDDA